MKFILLCILSCCSPTVLSQQLSGKVTYIVSMESYTKEKIDSIARNFKTKNIKMYKWMRDIFENTPDVKAFLEFNNTEALYFVEDKMQNDGKPTYNVNRTSAGGYDQYYKNTKTGEYFKENSTFEELLLIEIDTKKWEITQESKKIGNYLCYKAIDIASTNRKMKPVVWFTPEIPVSFGPLKYNGLPGLVLLVEMYKRTISVSEIILNPKDEIIINKPTKGEKITAEEARQRGAAMWKK
ncbi:GLPGLI family protein [Polaribacter litorisediminis]|uniref:GLPGLI family protein n=1 Tax=Polaribacter litorisediminis TaxID=1908341 RepID=UPI001CC07821|nr:GLPGLI family protein [Polaribacter litorisediminis]UAM97891.1 GLPGLI family protein [Polaribacter litorisediminis]